MTITSLAGQDKMFIIMKELKSSFWCLCGKDPHSLIRCACIYLKQLVPLFKCAAVQEARICLRCDGQAGPCVWHWTKKGGVANSVGALGLLSGAYC